MAITSYEDIRLENVNTGSKLQRENNAYSGEIPVNEASAVDGFKTAGYLQQLVLG